MQGNANTWWDASKGQIFLEGTALSWDAFVRVFNAKYFSDCAGEQKLIEFMNLRQNQMTVDQYEARFAELSRYAQRMVEDPEDKARRFRDGLKSEIKDVLVPFNLKNYNELYERAQLVERNLNERAAASGLRFMRSNRRDIRQGKRPMSSGKTHIPPNRAGAINKPMYRRYEECRMCRQRHRPGPCPMRIGACFGCGQIGHQVRDCPQRQENRPREEQLGGYTPRNVQNRPTMQGRVFAVTRDEAKDLPTVTGTILLHDQVAHALFDPSATHSFVAEQFVKLIGLSPKPLGTMFRISTPLKDSVVAAVGCPGCKLVVGSYEDKIDLIVLKMYDFDLIVGMDWLTKQRATIDCYHKVIQFSPLDKASFKFMDNRGETSIGVISSLEATRLLESGCQGYLASIVDVTFEEPKLEDIPVV
ncbi:uncharacterized protein LOC115726558 [Rhodamnia argentea]|uniref:Uncharacterized protein LOC115726558 n=1 Tax=Rhodamnia argentea TaxID=178133 RepID=A0A8B8MP29_9MYRT|nr:uncharacterized protein LOC115726558 [Rhodamnia argentea]